MSHKNFNLAVSLATTNEWLTPPSLISKLGHFDLDPCAPPIERRPWSMADKHYTEEDDGLTSPWTGRVFLNPPYGRETFKWMNILSEHKSGIALIFARTDTIGFHKEIFNKAHSVFFLKGRLKFHGIHDSHLLKYGSEEFVKAERKRINKKNLIPINDRYFVFEGDSANASSCLVSYSDQDTKSLENLSIEGKLLYM